MKILKQNALFLLALPLILLALRLVALPGKDVLECGLPGGGEFILTVRYRWYPIAYLVPVIFPREHYDGKWTVEYAEKREWVRKKVSVPPYNQIGFNGGAAWDQRQACATMGKIRETAIGIGSYLKPDENWFSIYSIQGGPRQGVSTSASMPPQPDMSTLEKGGILDTGPALVAPDGDSIVFEEALYRRHSAPDGTTPIDGVLQAFSNDGGRTWSKAEIVTAHARIYQIGKSRLDQCFVARPIRINGRQFEPDFPVPCPESRK